MDPIFFNTPDRLYFDGDKGLLNTPYLFKKLRKRRYMIMLERRDILYRPGDPIDTCYLLEKGAVIAYEFSAGNRRIFDLYEANTLLFCEYAVFNRPSCFFYEAQEPTVLYTIQLPFVQKLIENDPQFAHCVIAQLTRNLLVTQDLFRKTITHSARWRVCDFLIVFAMRSNPEGKNSVVLSHRITQKMMADMLNINRITAMQELHTLEYLGLCCRSGGHFEIPDIRLLQEYRDRFA